MNRLRKMVFGFIRKYFWSDYNPNEDFGCMYCGKQMLRRYLYCSQRCQDKDGML